MIGANYVIGVPVSASSMDKAVDFIIDRAIKIESGYVCVANTHMVTLARQNDSLLLAMKKSELVVTDGMPLVWVLKLKGNNEAQRVAGPNLTDKLCESAEINGVPVYFLGGSLSTIKKLKKVIEEKYPSLSVVGYESPPMLPEKPTVDQRIIDKINESGAKIVFIGLGCPKQEYWMSAYSPYLKPMLIGVGAAFDFLSGEVRRAPVWMQSNGLEWLFRLAQEPGRLWRRYVIYNTLFVFYFLVEFVRGKRASRK